MSERMIIETRDVTKRFNGFTAVSGVSFRLREGQTAGIIGPNGAGKTTFFNLLTGLFSPSEGKIFFDGGDITGVPSHQRTIRGLVRTFQLVSVFDTLPVMDNLVLAVVRFSNQRMSKRGFFLSDARQPAVTEACREALGMMGLGPAAHLMTSELSYGDKRKLEIAIALAMKPKVLLLDEPFAGLSDAEITEVLQLIGRVKAHCSLVIIEHKISRIVELVERLSVMHEGKIIAEGAPREVLCDPVVREVYWGKEEGLACSV